MIDLEKGVVWAEATANDNAHGYAQDNRWGPDYDCSSFVITALKQAGFAVQATYTGTMRSALLAAGFEDVTAKVNLSTGAGVQRGDVLLNDSSHTALALGGGKIVQASINEKGTVTGGQTGDQTGREIYIRSYYNYPWNVVLRYTAGETSPGGEATQAEKGEEEAAMRMLKKGDKGYQVWVLQTLLIARNFSCGETGNDSEFGSATKAAVINFQSANGLEVDGIVGPMTWAQLLRG